jgi:hypothetical protein
MHVIRRLAAAAVLAVMGVRATLCRAQEGSAGEAPKILSATPAAGATDVDPAIQEITVTFDRDMGKGFSWTGGGPDHPPVAEGLRPFWRDARTAVLPVSLATGRYYRVGINSKSHRNFRSAAGVPAQPSALFFTTRGAAPELTAKVRAAAGAPSARASRPLQMSFSPDKIQMPARKFPDVTGVVIDGALDTSPEKIEAVVRGMREQSAAQQAGDEARVQALNRWAESNLVNVVHPTRPIPRAVVALFRHAEGVAGEPLQSVTADGQGKFEFFDVPRGLYRIVAKDTRNGTDACPAAELTMEHYRTREHVRLVVHPQTVTLTGRVPDSAGKPLANAAVSAKQGHEHYTETEGDFTRSYHETAAQTDADGRYELRGLVPAGWWEARGLEGGGYGSADSWYTVAVSAPGYGSAKAFVQVAPEEAREAARRAAAMWLEATTPHQRARIREAGPARLPPCRGHALSGVDFVLSKPASAAGVVVDSGGRPCVGYHVALDATNRLDLLSCAQRNEAPMWVRTDEKGAFRVTGVSPGTYRVKVYEGSRGVNGKAPPVVTVREGEALAGLRLVGDAPPCGKIVGVVTDASSGRPVKGVSVYSAHKETGSTKCPAFLCLCGKIGSHTEACKRWVDLAFQTNDLRVSTFVVEKAAPGPTELVLKAPDYAEERVTVDVAPAGVTRPQIKLWRAGTLRIRPSIGADARVDRYASVPGKPPLVEYRAFPETGGPGVDGGGPSKQQAGCDEFAGLKPGRYTLRGGIRHLPGAVMRYESVPVEVASEQTRDVALAFDGACEVRIELVFPPGKAVALRLETADTPAGLDEGRNPGLRASGFFREPGNDVIPGLKPGAYRLSLFCRDVRPAKGTAEKKEPDETRLITLQAGQAAPALAFTWEAE